MDDKIHTLFDEEDVKLRVSKVWEIVFRGSNSVLLQAKKYGFTGMEVIPNPNIHTILVSVRMLSAIISTLLADDILDYDEKRLMLNSKEQLARMERVAEALIAENRGDFDEAIKFLESQAVF